MHQSAPPSHPQPSTQFGSFAGQLGDGAAVYLGEVPRATGARWELQLKGAGLTPYSRAADGRKVLRSSLREFLCSEAMAALGVPTTRAGALVTSDTRVERDPAYDGHPVMVGGGWHPRQGLGPGQELPWPGGANQTLGQVS